MGKVPFKPAPEAANASAAQAVWFDQVANLVTEQLVKKWEGKLAGVDTFTHDTVISAIVSISTDAPEIPASSLK